MSASAPPVRLVFQNRCAAGRLLGARLASWRLEQPLVLALGRGGVAVGYEVARVLGAPLDMLAVRKVIAPAARPALVIGAVAPGVTYLDEETIALVGVPRAQVDAAVARERKVVARLTRELGDAAPRHRLRGHTVLIVDDGIVTGASALGAVELVRQEGAARVIVAAPVCAAGSGERVGARADGVVCLTEPEDPRPLACWYADFAPVSDAEVRRLLKVARLEREAGFHPAAVPA